LNENIEKNEKNEKKLAANESAAHELPMLSLSNVFSVDEAVGFEVKLRRALGGEWFDEDAFDVGGAVQPRAGAAEKNQKNKNELEIKFIAEPKIDGASASVTYVDGVLVRCVSRGDGTTGEDVSRQLAGALGIPEKLNDVGGGKKIPRKIEIRGEVFIADDDFLTVNSRRTENGLVPFRNPRNAVAGALRKLGGTCAHDGTEVWPLRFITYAWGAVVGDEEYEESESGQNSEKNEPSPSLFWRSQSEFKEFARSVGLTPVPTLASGNGIRSVLGAHMRLSENKPKNSPTNGESNRRREDLGYAVDGVVYKVDCVSLQKKLGADARAPRWATAHKFPAATGVTVLHAIEIQVGRTGALTPVAVLSPPVDLGGTGLSQPQC
jgi:DNA ligase (NAD+)